MKKITLYIIILITSAFQIALSQNLVNNLSQSKITSKTDILAGTTASLVTNWNDVEMNTSNDIHFYSPTVILNKTSLKADRVIFENTVTAIQIVGTVSIDCKKIVFNPGGAGFAISNPNGKAELSITYTAGNINAVSIIDAENFIITKKRN